MASTAGVHNTAQWALGDLGVAHLHLGDHASAGACFDRARLASEEVGDGAGEVLAGYGYALLARVQGKWNAARRGFTDAVAGFNDLGTPVAGGAALAGLARCDEQDGLVDAAADRYHEVLRTGQDAGEPELVAAGLEGLARVATTRGDDEQATALWDRASAVRVRSHRPAPPHERTSPAGTG